MEGKGDWSELMRNRQKNKLKKKLGRRRIKRLGGEETTKDL